MKVLIGGISPAGNVALEFCAGMMRFQSELLRTPNIQAGFEIFKTLNSGLSHFYSNKEYDFCVFIDTVMFVDTGFLVTFDNHKDFVVGIYPLPGIIDWKRVADRISESSEDPHLVGNVYNVEPHKKSQNDGSFLQVDSAGLGILKMSRKGIEDIVARHAKDVLAADGKTVVVHTPCILGGKALTADERLCALWGKPIYADLLHKTRVSGIVAFTGCAGTRTVLR